MAPSIALSPAPVSRTISPEHEPPREPYRGLNPFRFVDSEVFFGRESDLLHLVRGLVVYRGMLLYGAQGVGKSSLLNAGLVPELLGGGFVPERLRVQPVAGAEIVVERISRHDNGAPPYVPSLLVGDERTARPTISAAALLERVKSLPRTARPVLIFDQLEELVTRFEDAPPASDRAAALETQRAIVDAIVSIMLSSHVRARVLLSFREDYLARVLALFQRVPELPDQQLRLLAPGIADLETIIRGPIERFPERFGRFPPELPVRLRDAFAERLGGAPVVLSELQIACLQLWKADEPLALLARPGGLDALLQEYLTAQIERFTRQEQEAIGAMLSAMVTRGGVRNIISRDLLLEKLKGETLLDAPQLEALLARIDGGETQLVRRERRQDVEYYTIVSEFLVPWIRQWREQRVKAEADRRVSETVAAEEAKRARQQTRWMRYAAVAALIVMLGAIGSAIKLSNANDALLDANDALSNSRLKLLEANAALADTITLLQSLRADADLVARQRFDSLALLNEQEAKQRISLDSARGDVGRQLANERRLRIELESQLKNVRATLVTAQAAPGYDSGAIDVYRRAADSARVQLQREQGRREALERTIRTWIVMGLKDGDVHVRMFARGMCSQVSMPCDTVTRQSKK